MQVNTSKYTQKLRIMLLRYVYAYANLNPFMTGRKMLWPIRKIFSYIINIRRYTDMHKGMRAGLLDLKTNFLYDSHIK